MDRLTKPGGSYCDDCVAFSKPDEFCEEYAACMDEIAMYDRLAAYEDTGLEPSEVEFVLGEYERFTKLEREGRLIVLPCKVGDTVYKVWYDPCHNGETHPDSYGCSGCEDVCDIKKSVHEMKAPSVDWILRQLHNGSFVYFLTPEEAEAALGGDGE